MFLVFCQCLALVVVQNQYILLPLQIALSGCLHGYSGPIIALIFDESMAFWIPLSLFKTATSRVAGSYFANLHGLLQFLLMVSSSGRYSSIAIAVYSVLISLPALQIQNGSACIHLSCLKALSCLTSSHPKEKDSPVAQSEADLPATDAEKAVEAIQISNLN
ncbi:hypothetical protein [Rubinisphaera sp.]|uniref:hypothetical protein n=1 Tax=Rubinisphaera sp. TaxID=2024857 RepID=UPI0025D26F9A|nr:hypothetical protein [Rubinisphaera sp.]